MEFCSAAKLAYEQAQAAIDGHPDEKTGPLLEPILKPLWAAYGVLSRGRDQREPLAIDLPERKVLLAEDGSVERIFVPPRLEAHRLIEEFMIQANVCAAETLEARRSPVVYRIHDEPSWEKLEALREFLGTLDMSFPKAGNLRPSQFNRVLERVTESPNALLVNEVILRSQSQAEYAVENIGHFGLNLRRYAHFTSPIRRYPDLLVHRGIKAILAGKRYEAGDLHAVGEHCSETERRADDATRDVEAWLKSYYMQDHVGEEFEGTISGVTNFGLFVTLDDLFVDGLVHISDLGQDYFQFDAHKHMLRGERSGAKYQLAGRVRVKVVRVNLEQAKIDFTLVEAASPSPLGEGRGEGQREGRGEGKKKPRDIDKKMKKIEKYK